MAEALDLLMEWHVAPFATFEVRDELSTAIARLIEGFAAGDEGPMRRSLHGTG